MTQASSEPLGSADRRHSSQRIGRRWWLGGLLVLLVLAVGGVLILASHQGVFARGPAVDATTAYLNALERRDYPAAYALLAPDLRARQSEADFAASMDDISAASGALTHFQVRDLHPGGQTAVVTVELNRALRGTFMVRVQVARSATGAWQISGADDL
jgi:hypothetical protein